MTDQESIYLLLLLAIVIMAVLFPPGPGTPLRDRVQVPSELAGRA
jgi:hypothetical protein